MSDYDPNRMPPERPDPRDARYNTAAGFNWNWIIGGIAAIVVLLVALSFVGRNDETAVTGTPPATTTGQSTPAERTAPRPANPNVNPSGTAPQTTPPATPPAKQ